MTRSAAGIIAAFVLLLWLLHPARVAEPSRVPCWRIKAALILHGIDPKDRAAVRLAARARGYTESEIAEAERRCLP